MARPKTEAQRVAALVKQGAPRKAAVAHVRELMRHEGGVRDEDGKPIPLGAAVVE